MNKILTIKQLNNYIKGVFEDEIILHDVTVSGEISEFRLIGNNTFIVLKDEENILSCYKFGLVEQMEIGCKVKITGKVNFYASLGKISLTIKRIQYDGEGEQRLALLRLKEQLEKEGLFKGRALPFFIKKVALITSIEGAVLHDFVSVISKSEFTPDILIFPVRVQGNEAIDTVTKALDNANSYDPDLIVLARGGGSQNDLGCFNSEKLARHVNSSRVPVLSAIGHEIDYSLCDFCAAARAGTPSIAAQMVAEINRSAVKLFAGEVAKMQDFINKFFEYKYRQASVEFEKLYHAANYALGRLKDRVIKCCISLVKYNEVEKKRKLLEEQCAKIQFQQKKISEIAESRLSEQIMKLDLLSPLKIIGQGYGKVSLNGKEINDVAELAVDDNVKVIMRDGTAYAKIIKTERRHL